MQNIYVTQCIQSTENTTDFFDDYWSITNNYEEAKETINKYLKNENHQGFTSYGELYKFSVDEISFYKELGLENESDNDLVEIFSSEMYGEDFVDFADKFKAIEIHKSAYNDFFEIFDFEQISITGKLIISYKHMKHMNYAHKIERIWIADAKDTVSTNPDQVYAIWDLVTEIKEADLKSATIDDALELISLETTHLKLQNGSEIKEMIQNLNIVPVLG